ncbi:MAG: GTP-binding protein, partial [Acidobacteriota bacterium]
MIHAAKVFKEHELTGELILDNNDLERERGITILAKNVSIRWKDCKVNIIDTPGHADFGGEVERTLRMVDGVLLLVDAAEGPLPQTKFVLKKSLELGLKPVVVINKIDRKDARADEVLNEVFDLFVALGASDEQLDFAYVYAIAKQGIAKLNLEDNSETLEPLLDLMLERIPVPKADRGEPFRMLISAIDYNDYLGRIGIGKVHYGSVKVGDQIVLLTRDGDRQNAKVTKLYEFENIKRKEVTDAHAGDIIAIAGLEDLDIGDTLCDPNMVEKIESIAVEEPRITMNFMVNNSPFAGQDGKYVTTRNLSERLSKELKSNVGLRVEMTDSPDVFKVSGRGELHLSIL